MMHAMGFGWYQRHPFISSIWLSCNKCSVAEPCSVPSVCKSKTTCNCACLPRVISIYLYGFISKPIYYASTPSILFFHYSKNIAKIIRPLVRHQHPKNTIRMIGVYQLNSLDFVSNNTNK